MAPVAGRPAVARSAARRLQSSVLEYLVIVAVALGLALAIQAILVKPFKIPSPSMMPTLQEGQRVLVERVSPRFSEPSRGDVVVFHPPAGAESGQCGVVGHETRDQACPRPTRALSDENYIKRIVAGPGDRLKVVGGRVYVNGERQQEPFARANLCGRDPTCQLTEEITIPPGHLFMMGDNRGESADSRVWGPIPRDAVIGNAFFTYWPPSRIGTL